MAATPRTRSSAPERRDELVRAAVGAFAHTGLHGTAVSAITDAVGVTQPYAFSLFGTKKDLFLAAVEHGFARTEAVFRGAAEEAGTDAPQERLAAMGHAYQALLADRDLLLLQLQAYAACGDDDVRAVVQRCYRELYRAVREMSGVDDATARDFFRTGMLLNVAAAIDLPTLADDGCVDWLSD